MEARIRIRIRIKGWTRIRILVNGRIRVRIKVINRIRILINVMRIRNSASNRVKFKFTTLLLYCVQVPSYRSVLGIPMSVLWCRFDADPDPVWPSIWILIRILPKTRPDQ
jgi:hypothetical protein